MIDFSLSPLGGKKKGVIVWVEELKSRKEKIKDKRRKIKGLKG